MQRGEPGDEAKEEGKYSNHTYTSTVHVPFSMNLLGAQSGSDGGGGGGRSTGGLGPLRLPSLALRMSSGLNGAGPEGSLGLGLGAVD